MIVPFTIFAFPCNTGNRISFHKTDIYMSNSPEKSSTNSAFDLIILGSGPGGYVCAIRAAQLGLSVAIVEEKHLGGVCLNWGCIPTKALLRTSELYTLIHHAENFGLQVENTKFNIEDVIKRSRDVSAKLANGVKHLLKKNKVKVFQGRGQFLEKDGEDHRIEVTYTSDKEQNKDIIHGKTIVIATGAHARSLPNLDVKSLGVDENVVWSAKEAMVPKKMPKSLLVIGSGAIGIEFASFYNGMGADVTVVEMQDRILPAEDREISEFAKKSFTSQGINIVTNATVNEFEKADSGILATIQSSSKSSDGKILYDKKAFDNVIVAIGVVGNTNNIGLEHTHVKVEKNQIIINQWCQTHEKGVYAIGDVAGAPWLAHKASHEGVMVAEKVAGYKGAHPLDKKAVPGCTYSYPQIASIGITEQEAKEQGLDVKIGRFSFVGNGKAIAMGEAEGMMKTIFDAKTGAFIGAHLIGAEVTEMIQGFAIALTLEATEEDLMRTVFPHPTLSEMMHESTLDAYDKVIHM